MLQFDWSINVGEVITLLSAIGSFCYLLGRLNQKVEGLGGTIDSLKTDFSQHCDQNVEQFDAVRHDMALIVTKKGD